MCSPNKYAITCLVAPMTQQSKTKINLKSIFFVDYLFTNYFADPAKAWAAFPKPA